MESCLNYKPQRVGSVVVEDLKKNLFSEFSKIPTESQEAVLLEKEHLQVYLRIRPFTAAESDLGESQECVTIEPPNTVVLKAPRTSLSARQSDKWGPQIAQRFQFSQVYGPETTQRQIFDGSTKSLVKDVLEGGNSVVFTYGVTNAGKTFTFLGPETDGGILPRSLNVIFNSIEGRIYTQNNIKPHRCVDFTRLTKDQQDEEAANKRNILRRFKEGNSQNTMSSMSSSCGKTLLEGSLSSDVDGQIDGDSLCMEDDPHVKFSVWVSFCEIYNESIHDLLDLIPNGSQKRNVLRLSQDIKGNAFVKDLKWIQVNNANEAYKIVKIGRKNQSFSSTKLNNVSSRSHSIFSIRILRIEDVGVPRVQTISELTLCDLAGSERCAKTQNRGDRLKEAGNINTSLLTLGKCINALRLNQTQSKFQQHIPFRESKLTHYLQGFFCGRGKACMIVNINQCASMYDETLNVLKFSAVAQKVVVLNPKSAFIVPKRSARDVSLIINSADSREPLGRRKSSLMGWDMSLEDVQEDECDDDDVEEEEEEESEEESMVEDTILEAGEDQCVSQLKEQIEELKEKLCREQSEKLVLESRIREEVNTEFMELFSNMEKDYNERLQREKEIVEERAERRLEILKNLVNRNASELAAASCAEESTQEAKIAFLNGMIETMRDDLAKIKMDAETAQTCLVNEPDSPGTIGSLRAQLEELNQELLKSRQLLSLKTKELETTQAQTQESNELLQEAERNLESQTMKCQELMAICQEKDDVIVKLQTALDQNVETATKDRVLIDSIKEEILHLRNNCKCVRSNDHVSDEEGRESQVGLVKSRNLDIQKLVEEVKSKDEILDELRYEKSSLEHTVQCLTKDLEKQEQACEAALSSLTAERTETAKLTDENKALTSELRLLQVTAYELSTKLKSTESKLSTQKEITDKLTEDLEATKTLLKERDDESSVQSKTIESLMREAERLRQKLAKEEFSPAQRSSSAFRDTIEALRKECEKMVGTSQDKNLQIENMEKELNQAREQVRLLEQQCHQLRQERDVQSDKIQSLLSSYEAEKLTAKQMRSTHCEQQATLEQQLAELQEQVQASRSSSDRITKLENELAAKESQIQSLQENLREAQIQLGQEQEERRRDRCRARDEEEEQRMEISRQRDETKKRITEVKAELAQKDGALERSAQELSKSEELVNDGLDKIKSLSLELQIKEKEISDLTEQLTDRNTQIDRLQKEITSMNEEKKSLQLKLGDSERVKNQALISLSSMERTIHQLSTSRGEASRAKSEANSPRDHRDRQEPPAKAVAVEDTHLTLTDQERTQKKQEQELEAKLRQIESLSKELMKLRERYQRERTGDSENSHVPQRDSNSDVSARHQPADKRKGLEKEQIWPDGATGSQQVSVLDSSVISSESGKSQRFPKPELEIHFSPLKPNSVNVRRPGEDSPVTIKIRRTARKRKSAELEDPVASENRKNVRLGGNSRMNIESTESSTALNKKANRPQQQDSPAGLKSKNDGTLQKIGDFIQSSPTLLGSKAKKIIGIVTAKSPEPQSVPSNRPKRTKRKLFKTHVSSPMDIPSQPIVGTDEDKESDHLIIKRKLRTRTVKK
ncbi:kinesin-like protein KIF20B [Chanos chanos]|uniref:Kinesin-like protein KIF20B n=1 Tax=Chanos chanos TaxID=29144 RepID=A0A6J2VGG9_CHACN|nr:kinesin-like protein KIF20B [Chanos chanos]